jgi:hypothetical protein
MLIKNFIDQNTCNHFVQILAKSKYLNYEKDNQITNETTKGYYKALQKFHLSQTERVSEIFKKELIPTNDYSRIYTKGSTLVEHTDDGKCEYSLTVNLLNTPEYERWPFYTETNNIIQKYIMGPGDAVFYYGIAQKHWREELLYDKCYQMFLHYVDKNGSNAHLGIANYKDFL